MLQQVLYYTYNDLKYKISLDAVAKAKASEDKAPTCSPFTLCQELAKSNMTIVIVSHSLGSIRKLCNRAIWINNGEKRRLQRSGH